MARRCLAFVALFVAAAICAASPAQRLRWLGATDIALGKAERGPWQQNDSRYDFVDDPAVAIDSSGQIVVAWVDQAKKDVLFHRLAHDGKPVGQPLNVSRSPDTFSWLPRIALAPHDSKRVFVLWQEIIFSGGSHGGDIVFARSEDGGRSFSKPVNLSNSRAGDGKGRLSRKSWHNGSLDIAVGADGAVYAAWTEYEGRLWLAVSGDGGRGFSAARPVAGDDRQPARAPSLAVGPDRVLYLAWTVGEDNAAAIRVARSTDGGANFEAPQLLAANGEYSDAPKLATDSQGMLHLAYAGGRRVLYTRSTDSARSFERSRVLAKSAGFPSIGVDAHGGVFVTWESLGKRRELTRGLGIAVSRDRGATFTDAAEVPKSADAHGGRNGSSQGLLMKKLAVNARGDVVVANSSFRGGSESRVWLIRAETLPERLTARDR